MGCLDNLVGLKGCGDVAPTSGIYIDDILPINRDHFQEIADGYQLTADQLFSEKYSAAIKTVANDLKKNLTNYSFKGTIESRTIGETRDVPVYLPVDASERGIDIRFRDNCELAVFRVKQIEFCRKDNTSANVLIYEADKYGDALQLTHTIALGTEESYNTPITLNGQHIRILVDDSTHEVCDLDNTDLNGLCCYRSCCNYFYASGWDGANLSQKTYGLRVKLDVLCDIETLMCKVSESIAFLVAYKIYILILRQAQMSQKASIFMSGAEDQIRLEIMRFEDGFTSGGKYVQGKYYTEIEQVALEIEGLIKMAQCSACFECKTPYNAKSYN